MLNMMTTKTARTKRVINVKTTKVIKIWEEYLTEL